MNIALHRWTILSAILGLLGVFTWLLGDGFRVVADHNINLQTAYVRGVEFDLDHGFLRPQSGNAPPGVRVLYNAKFFREEIVEPQSVRTLKAELPPSLKDLFFPDKWQLLWYLSFTGDTNALYSVVDRGLRSGVFAESTGCTRFGECTVEDPRTTVNVSSSNRLFQLIVEQFIEPAMSDIEHGARVSARRRALDALQLIRLANLDKNQTTINYDRTLIMSSFLTRADVGGPALDTAVIKQIWDVPGTSGKVFTTSDDSDVKAYFEGVSLIRDHCALNASQVFFAQAVATDHTPLAELFSFLAVRSLASPIVIRSMLQLDESGELVVNDCGEIQPIDDFVASFVQLVTSEDLPNVTNIGLLSDLEFYRKLVPQSEEAKTSLLNTVVTSLPAESQSLTEMQYTEDTKSEDISDFYWPIRGDLISDFSSSGAGIRIAVPEGSTVRAVESGTVIYVGNTVEGYGNLILVKHGNDFSSVYAHLKEFIVDNGDAVVRGEALGTSGKTGSDGMPQLHFELRKDATPVDPVPLLGNASETPTDDPSDAGIPGNNVQDLISSLINGSQSVTEPLARLALSDSSSSAASSQIAQAQRGLVSLGFFNGPISGELDEKTEQAVRAFENFLSFQMTGEVSPELIEWLKDAGAYL